VCVFETIPTQKIRSSFASDIMPCSSILIYRNNPEITTYIFRNKCIYLSNS